jgi:hypothetical protein
MGLSPMTRAGVADKRGCFSRPGDSEEEFSATASSWNQSIGSWEYPPHLKEVFAERFGVELDSIPLQVSSKGLMPWELACCWLDEEGRGSIQMSPSTRPQNRVPLDVVLVHEAIHVVRGRLNATRFEEHIAYAACRAVFPKAFPRWRAWIGPLFSSVREVIALLVLLWGSWGLPLFLDTSVPTFLIAGIDLSIIGIFLIRLHGRWTVWNKAMNAITSQWPTTAWRLMIRMTDEEVEWLSTIPKNRVREEIAQKAATEWRWRCFFDGLLKGL